MPAARRPAAIKQVRMAPTGMEGTTLAEIAALRELNHPNVIK